jgi:protein O-GlcNAc transferase
MSLPKWTKNKTWQWIIGTLILLLGIITPLVCSSPNQTIKNNGNYNFNTQVSGSNNIIQINKIDPEEIAKSMVERSKYEIKLEDKENEIKALKSSIERLKKSSVDDELKRKALRELSLNNTIKAIELLEKSAETHSKKAAQNWIDLGNIAYLSDTNKALSSYQKAIELEPKNFYPWNRLGLIFTRLGNIDKAKNSFEKVIDLAQGDKNILAMVSCNIANLYIACEDLEKALEIHEGLIKTYKELGDKKGIANSYSNIGVIYMTQGSLVKALDSHKKSLELGKEIDDKEIIAANYINIGNIYTERRDLENALEMYEKSMEILKKLGVNLGIANCYGNIGVVYDKKGDLVKALDSYENSLKLNKKLGHKIGMADNYNNEGIIYSKLGYMNKALEMHKNALKIYKEFDRKTDIAKCYNNIGQTYINMTNYDTDHALEMIHEALKLYEELDDKRGIASCYGNIGIVHMDRGELNESKEALVLSLDLLKKFGTKNEIEKAERYVEKLKLKK